MSTEIKTFSVRKVHTKTNVRYRYRIGRVDYAQRDMRTMRKGFTFRYDISMSVVDIDVVEKLWKDKLTKGGHGFTSNRGIVQPTSAIPTNPQIYPNHVGV